MPIIYRPDTDIQRLQAMEAAKAKADVTPVTQLAFSADTLAVLLPFLTQFKQEVQQRGTALSAQAAATAAANPARKALDMYIRHFISVFNLGVDRDKYPATDRAHYQLPVDYHKYPELGTDSAKLLWARNIVDGDATRVTAGGAAMENPTAAEVDAKLTDLTNALGAQNPAKDAYDKEQEDVAALRNQADDIIADVQDTVLFTFRKDDAPSMRRKARGYGIVYRLSKEEVPTPDEFSAAGKVSELNANGQGMPMADVEVTLVETNFAVLTDANGNYLMPYQTAGNYNLRFKKEGYTEQTHPITITEGEITELDVQLEPMMPPPMP